VLRVYKINDDDDVYFIKLQHVGYKN
jgi:hypothetical protein